MTIRTVRRYRRADLQANPGTLYVFGDNMTGLGRAGQAAECRGEPNAVGVPTKWRPSNEEGAFFTDDNLPRVKFAIQHAYRRLAEHIRAGGDVVFPADGLGTGLAQLPERAPAVAAFIERCSQHLRTLTELDPR